MKRTNGIRVLTLLLAVTMMGTCFTGCGISRGAAHTFAAANDPTGERQWRVKLDRSSVVSYEIQTSDDGEETNIVFTGLRRGNTQATVYLARDGESVRMADNVYVLDLHVDLMKNVTEKTPRYGEYSVRCKGSVSGSEWHVECDESIVHWSSDREYPKKRSLEDGMQDFIQVFSFTGRRPGAAHVRIFLTYPWADDVENTIEDFWLYVDGDYRVSALETQDFTSLRLSVQGMRAEHDVIEAQKTENGVRLTHYEATYNWSDEARDTVETRRDETVADAGEAVYLYLAGMLHACKVADWDGFQKSDPRILDGKMFTFEAVLADGKTVKASGSNSYPAHYREFHTDLQDLVNEYKAKEDAQ